MKSTAKITFLLVAILALSVATAWSLEYYVIGSPDPAVIDFGTVPSGEDATVTLVLINDSPVTITLLGRTYSGNFALAENSPSFEPVQLLAGEGFNWNITFPSDGLKGVGFIHVYTLGGGSVTLDIPMTINKNAASAAGEKEPVENDEGFFIGPCFVDTLFLR